MPKIVDKERKAKHIAQSALTVFLEKGFHQTTMADIAESAEVGKGTIYEYFKDKLQILQFELDQYFSSFKQGVLQVLSGKSRPEEQLVSLVDFAFDHVADWERHCAIFVDAFSLARTGGDSEVTLTEVYEEMRALLRTLVQSGQASGSIRRDIDPVAASELLVSIFDGIVLHGVFGGRERSLESLKKVALKLVSNGLLEREAPPT